MAVPLVPVAVTHLEVEGPLVTPATTQALRAVVLALAVAVPAHRAPHQRVRPERLAL